MKATLFTLTLLCATSAVGQSGSSISSEPRPIQIPSHSLRASQRFMLPEQSLLIATTSVSARGERPLWEFAAKPTAEIPLGDVARLLRYQHATVKKATKVVAQ